MKVKKLFEDAILPVRENPTDSGMDVFANNIKKYYYYMDDKTKTEFVNKKCEFPIILKPSERVFIGTGISTSIDVGYEIQVRPRSGLALKNGLSIVNSPGTVDQSYTGEISITLINLSNTSQIIEKDMKIAQLVVCPIILCSIEEVDMLDSSDRGNKGFGSSGN